MKNNEEKEPLWLTTIKIVGYLVGMLLVTQLCGKKAILSFFNNPNYFPEKKKYIQAPTYYKYSRPIKEENKNGVFEDWNSLYKNEYYGIIWDLSKEYTWYPHSVSGDEIFKAREPEYDLTVTICVDPWDGSDIWEHIEEYQSLIEGIANVSAKDLGQKVISATAAQSYFDSRKAIKTRCDQAKGGKHTVMISYFITTQDYLVKFSIAGNSLSGAQMIDEVANKLLSNVSVREK